MRHHYLTKITFILFAAVLLAAGSPFPAGAQSVYNAYTETEFGAIPDSLFQMEQYAPDPDAPFIYGLKEADITFDSDEQSIIAVLNYHVRVKVFDASHREASVVAIPYYFSNNIEQVADIRAVTYHPSGEVYTLSRDAIRTININSRYSVKEFTMPQVEDGSVLEYSYQIRRRYIDELPDFYLAHEVPTARAQVRVLYPQYLRYEVIQENYDGRVHHFSQKIDTSTAAKVFTVPQPAPLLRETWVARQVPALEDEAYISSINDYRGKLKFKLSEFGRPRQRLENSWDLVVAELRRNQNALEMARRNRSARETGAAIARALDSQQAVQDSIFRYVNERSNFNGAQSPYSTTGDQPVLRGEPADQAAINQTLLAMLQGAGIEAWPMLISTREFGQINKSFPSFFQFNGQLVWSRIEGEEYFMDASFPHSQPNLIPVTTYNETGLLLRPEDYEWKEIRPSRSNFAISIKLKATLDANGNLSGTMHSESSGYPAQAVRQKFANGDRAEQIISQAVFDGYGNIRLASTQLENLHSYEEPVVFNTNFSIQNYATSFSNGLQFRPLVVGYLMSNPFNEGRRDLPVTLDAPEKLDLVFEISLPRGFGLEQGVQNHSVELPGARLSESYDMEERLLRYGFHIDISRKRFGPELYPQLLNLYKRWVQLSNTKWLIERN